VALARFDVGHEQFFQFLKGPQRACRDD
jgi:hypothetical protein